MSNICQQAGRCHTLLSRSDEISLLVCFFNSDDDGGDPVLTFCEGLSPNNSWAEFL